MGKKSKRRTTKKTQPTVSKNEVPAVSVPAKAKVKVATPPAPAPAPAPAPKLQPEPAVTLPSALESKNRHLLTPAQALESNSHLLTPAQQNLAKALCAAPTNQAHLFASWSTAPDSSKIALISQLERMDKSYPSGGLTGYISNAKELLERSRMGDNPLKGWKPEVPIGESLQIGTEDYDKFEGIGMNEMGKCGFVLVAGGLGERLGYGGIKLGLPTELATETCYLQYYIETILSIQDRYAAPGTKLPLCIMVSNDTSAGTMNLLESNDYFGMDKDQITIVQQGDGVPALQDNDATIAMDKEDPCKIQAKPHGHGDIHALLHRNKVALNWCMKGMEWVIFFQDTNGLAFHTLPLALGVSKSRDLVMNSIAVPRKAKQAIGGIAKLVNDNGGERTINVEYNQLDPLLRSSGFPDGDVNDKTGFSPFPGNINQLIFKLKPYAEALLRTNGAMPEFVNPKYADEAKTIFKKPTRLECMMQDFPTILSGGAAKQVGCTSIPADLCFSPVKNATADGVNLQAKGTSAGVAATGEADQYAAVRMIMKSIGCTVEDAPEAKFSGIQIVPGPEIVTKPSFTVCPAEYKGRFPNPSKIKISARSSLVVGGNVVIESLDLDGALVIACEEGAEGTVRDLVVKNKGWEKVVDESDSSPEYIRIRGYRLNKIETKKIVFKNDGSNNVEPPPKSSSQKSDQAAPESTPAPPTLSRSLADDIEPVADGVPNLDLSAPSAAEVKSDSPMCCIIS